MSQSKNAKEDENNPPQKMDQMTLSDVPQLFYDSSSPESCILTILSELPPVFDETFDEALLKKIELAESSITIVAEHLTQDVLSSQQQIFDATDTFLSLNDNIFESSNFIHSIRDQVSNVREKTLSPILKILTYVRDLRRDTKALTVLHFIRCITLIFDALNSSNFVWASYTLLQIQYLLYKEKAIYTLDLFESFTGFTFASLPTNILSNDVPIQITVGELKKVKCIKNMISDIISFPPVLMAKMERQLLSDLSSQFDASKYSVIVVSYSLIHDHPPIARVLYENATKNIRQQSVAYFETKSNDLQTLFRFMESGCSIIENFNNFIKFHQNHQSFGSIVSELPIDIEVALLEKLPPDKDMHDKMKGIEGDFISYYTHLINVAESNVLQFLSRLKCTTLDALSFIQLVRALKEFNSFVKCNGLKDWISLTTEEFLKNYSSVSTTSVRKAVSSDSWVPTQTEESFIKLVQTMPSSNKNGSTTTTAGNEDKSEIFNFNNSYRDKAFKAFASSSAITTVRVIHSLICLSMELDSDTCLNLILQVSIYFVTCVINIFCSPQQIFVESNTENVYMINNNFRQFLQPEFANAVNQMLRILTDSTSSINNVSSSSGSFKLKESSSSFLSLSSSQSAFQPSTSNLPNSSEAQLMQMVTATDGLDLLLWYLNGIRENVLKRTKIFKETSFRNNASNYLAERANFFYKYVVDIVIPGFRKNIAALVMKNSGFLQIKNLKHQLQSSSWVVEEVTFEFHPFIVLAKKALDRLDQTLMNLQLKRNVMNDIYFGTWSYLAQEIISAFAAVKNCNGFGRSLMAADTKKIGEIFQSVAKIDPNTNLVLEYVNAFFFQVGEFSKWIETVPGRFKQKHIVALVKTGLNVKLSSNDSKALIAKIDSKYAAAMRI